MKSISKWIILISLSALFSLFILWPDLVSPKNSVPAVIIGSFIFFIIVTVVFYIFYKLFSIVGRFFKKIIGNLKIKERLLVPTKKIILKILIFIFFAILLLGNFILLFIALPLFITAVILNFLYKKTLNEKYLNKEKFVLGIFTSFVIFSLSFIFFPEIFGFIAGYPGFGSWRWSFAWPFNLYYNNFGSHPFLATLYRSTPFLFFNTLFFMKEKNIYIKKGLMWGSCMFEILYFIALGIVYFLFALGGG